MTESLSGPRLRARALDIAAQAHAGQTDHLGAPYLGHINRVMGHAETFRARHAPWLDPYDVAATAALHDTIEDTDTTLADLETAGIPEHVLHALTLLTHDNHEPRHDYLQRITTDPLARIVKLGDTHDNANPVRLAHLRATDPARAERLERKYRHAHDTLGPEGP